jgi:hypothetical protein
MRDSFANTGGTNISTAAVTQNVASILIIAAPVAGAPHWR